MVVERPQSEPGLVNVKRNRTVSPAALTDRSQPNTSLKLYDVHTEYSNPRRRVFMAAPRLYQIEILFMP